MISQLGVLLAIVPILGYIGKKIYLNQCRCKSNKRLDGKVAIITGANTGIGYETALDFAKRGARVILACRDLNRANKAASQIIAETDNKKVEVEHLDLADLESVRKFAALMNQKLNRLDLLVNNAGVMQCPYQKTKQGFEMQFGVNHLAHFLLTNLLIDLMKKNVDARIINVSSVYHFKGKIKWDDINSEKSYSPLNAYHQSKLANVLFTVELAERLADSPSVTAVSLHPGFVRTEILRHADFSADMPYKFIIIIFYPIWYLVSKSASEGSQTTIFCAVDDNVPQNKGRYFSDCKPVEMSNEVTKEQAKKLWDLSAKLVNL